MDWKWSSDAWGREFFLPVPFHSLSRVVSMDPYNGLLKNPGVINWAVYPYSNTTRFFFIAHLFSLLFCGRGYFPKRLDLQISQRPRPLDLNGSDVGHHGAIGFVVFDDVDQLMTIGVQQITKHLAVGTRWAPSRSF